MWWTPHLGMNCSDIWPTLVSELEFIILYLATFNLHFTPLTLEKDLFL
jgi:hypothetical protein